MKISWLGHHCFRIITDDGLKIITDPYVPGYRAILVGDLRYGELLYEEPDIVVISHEHADHNYTAMFNPGTFEVARGMDMRGAPKTLKGIEFKALACHHDDAGGKVHGENNIMYFEVDGIRICHNGDLAHKLSDEQIAELGRVDILLLAVSYVGRHPKGVRFEINTKWADILYDQLKPGVTLPGHYSNAKCTFKFAIVDEFLEGKSNVSRLDTRGISEVEFKKGQLPDSPQIIVLKSEY